MPETANIDLTKLRIQREESRQESPPSQRKTWLLLGAGVLALILAVVVLQSSFSTTNEVEVTTVTFVSPAQASAVLTASGYVVAQRKASIASKATGRLVYLGFEEGDRVKKGEIIARIESADVEASLAQARATLQQYKAELHDAQQSYQRARDLLERDLIAQAEYDAAKARYDRVAASIAVGEAAVKAAEVQVENTIIRAPFDGTILTKNADVGEVVAPFAAGASSRVAVVTIADMTSLEVEADVSESNIERISVGQPCEITLDAYSDKRYRGYVHRIVPTADRAKATVLTKIRFVEKDSRVLPEMSAKVQFLSKSVTLAEDIQPKLAVDAAAITTRDGKKVVFKVHDNTVTEVPVELGKLMGSSIEILHGISANDKLVLRPPENLTSGSRVKLKN